MRKSIPSDTGLRQPDTTSGKPKSIAYRKDTKEIVTTKEPKSIEYRKESTETVIKTKKENPKSIANKETLRK